MTFILSLLILIHSQVASTLPATPPGHALELRQNLHQGWVLVHKDSAMIQPPEPALSFLSAILGMAIADADKNLPWLEPFIVYRVGRIALSIKFDVPAEDQHLVWPVIQLLCEAMRKQMQHGGPMLFDGIAYDVDLPDWVFWISIKVYGGDRQHSLSGRSLDERGVRRR